LNHLHRVIPDLNRKGVYPPIPDIEKIKMIDMEDFDMKGFLKRKRNIRRFLS